MSEWDSFVASVVPGVIRAIPITKAHNAAKGSPGDSAQGLRNSLSRAFKRANLAADTFVIWEGIYAADAEKPDEKSPFLFVKSKADPAQAALPEGGDTTASAPGSEGDTTAAPASEPAAKTEPGKRAK